MADVPTEQAPAIAGPDLFIALGGRAGVGLIVDGLYDRLERDRALARLFGSRRSGERDRLKEFFESIFGGQPCRTQDIGVQRRHVHRLINAAESEQWLAHLAVAMIGAGCGDAVRIAAMGLLRGPAARLVNDGAPKPVLKQALAAAGNGNAEAIAALVEAHPRLINQRGGDGVTMLWAAARRGRLPLVQWLVINGADISIPGSAFHMIRVMVSPLCISIRSRRFGVAQYLRDQGAQVDVFSAAFLGDVTTLRHQILADQGNAVSPHDDFHTVTPLHHAVDGGSVDAVTMLLESGTRIGPSGGRLLTSAADQGSIDLVRLLLDHGAQAADAESLGHPGTDSTIGQLLVAHGFRLDVPIRNQETPLTKACRADKGEHPQRVTALLNLGADPNTPNAKGRTPLEIATRARFEQTMHLLRAAGAH